MMNKPIPPVLEAVNSEINRFIMQLLQQGRQVNEHDEFTPEASKTVKAAATFVSADDAKLKAQAEAEAETKAHAPLDFIQSKSEPLVSKIQTDVSKFFSGLPVYVLAEFDKKQSSIASILKKELDAIFAGILNPPEKLYKKKKNNIDDLTMIDDDLLVIRLTVDNFATKVNEEQKMAIAMACLRFEKVLGFEIDLMLTPVSPYHIGNVLEKSLSTLNLVINKTDVDIHRKKELLLAIFKSCIVEYPNLLKAVNDVFIRKGILPKLTEKDGKARIDKYVRQMKAVEEGREDDDDKGKKNKGDEEGTSVFAKDFFRNIAIPKESQHFVVSNPNGELIPQAQLLNNIDSMQSVLVAADQQSGYLQPVQTDSTFSELLATNTDIPAFALTAENSKTISIISMLFDTLKNEQSISGPIKALLLQLTVPLLKAAVQDDEFFSDKSNPAQVLFNSIAEASSSWTAENSVNNDFLYKKMSSIVQKVTEDYENDASVFETAVDDFEEFVDNEKEKSQKIEDRIIATETAQARIQAARKLAQKRIYDVFGDFILDEELKRFIDKSWEQVLFYITNTYFDEKNAEEWEQVEYIENNFAKILEYIRVPISLDELFVEIIKLFMITGRSESDIKSELEAIRPELEVLIEDADADADEAISNVVKLPVAKQASQVAVNKFAEDAEVDYIRDNDAGEDDFDEEIDTVDTLAEAAQVIGEGVVVDDIDDYEKNIQAEQDAAMHAVLEKVGIGSWLEDKGTDPSSKVKLAAHIKYTDTYVFVNRKGVKAVSYDGPTFASRLQENLMVVVDNSHLYDRSMENIIGSLRH